MNKAPVVYPMPPVTSRGQEVHEEQTSTLDMRNVWFGYDSDHPVLKDISLQVHAGEMLMVVGVSGGGKTTLMKLAKGLLAPQRGKVRVLGQQVGASLTGRLDARVAYIPQQLGLVRNLTAAENVLMGALSRVGALRSCFKLFPEAIRLEALGILESLAIGHKADEKVYALSGGERQRVAIARALMQQPRLLLADEFVSQLDAVRRAALMEIMRGLAKGGLGLIVSTHNLELVSRYADRVLVLRGGKIVLDAAPQDADIEALSREMER